MSLRQCFKYFKLDLSFGPKPVQFFKLAVCFECTYGRRLARVQPDQNLKWLWAFAQAGISGEWSGAA